MCSSDLENSALISSKQLEQISIRGRDVVSMLRILPGVSQTVDTEFLGGSFGTAIFQISFRIDSLPTLRAFYQRFKDEGMTHVIPRNHGNAWSLYTRDPEGNGLELFVDTPWFTHQPCGEPLDLSKSDDEIYKLTEELCRKRPDFEPFDDWRARMKDAIVKAQARLF